MGHAAQGDFERVKTWGAASVRSTIGTVMTTVGRPSTVVSLNGSLSWRATFYHKAPRSTLASSPFCLGECYRYIHHHAAGATVDMGRRNGHTPLFSIYHCDESTIDVLRTAQAGALLTFSIDHGLGLLST